MRGDVMSPMRPLRPCLYPSCPKLVQSGRCDKHKPDKQNIKLYDKQRGSNTERGYGYAWSLVRLDFLRHNPLCYDCLPEQVKPAKEVHHILAKRKGGKDNNDNLMSLCRRCHSIRTARGE